MYNAPVTPTHRAPAVSRAIAVLKLLGQSAEPLGVNAIARQLDLVPSSCLHILRALADDHLVRVDPDTKQYSLGLGLLALAHDMLGKDHFAALVQPALEHIAQTYGITGTAVELDSRDRMMVVAMAQASSVLKIQVGVGSRFPAFISATGRCVAAHSTLTEAQLKERFAALQWQAPPRFSDWLREIEAVRRHGVAVDADHYIVGFTIVAAPVLTGGPLRRAVSVVGASRHLSGKLLTEVKQQTKLAAARVAEQLRDVSRP